MCNFKEEMPSQVQRYEDIIEIKFDKLKELTYM